MVEIPPASAGDTGLVPGSGRPPGGGNGNPLQYSCLGNSMDRGAWQATARGVAKTDASMRAGRRGGYRAERIEFCSPHFPSVLFQGSLRTATATLRQSTFCDSSPHRSNVGIRIWKQRSRNTTLFKLLQNFSSSMELISVGLHLV